jgi:hypothetical protein
MYTGSDMMARGWTIGEELKLREMRAEKEKITYIACVLKRTPSSIAYKLHQMEDMTVNYNFWTTEEWKKAQALKNQGYTYKEIGTALNRKERHVKDRFLREKKKVEDKN